LLTASRWRRFSSAVELTECTDSGRKPDAVSGIGPTSAQIILAEFGADMSRFPTPEHLVSWAKLCPRTIQCGVKNTSGPAGQGNPWLKGALGEAANAAARTDTFLGARYRRIVKHRGHAKALVAVARSILVIAWHLINDPDASYQELGADWHRRHLDPARKTRDLVRQLQALGHQIAITLTCPSHRHPPSRTSIFRSASGLRGSRWTASIHP